MVKEVLRGILIALGFTISSPERISYMLSTNMASQVVLVVKNLSANAGDKRDVGLILGSGRSPGVRNGNPLQYSCLENYMDKEPCGLQSMGLQRAGQDWVTKYTCTSTKVISVSMVIFQPLPPSSQSVRTLYRISVLGRVLCLVLDNYFHIRCFIDKYNAAQCLN